MTPEVCCLCHFAIILFQLLSQKTQLHKDRMLEIEIGLLGAFVALSGYSTVTLIQDIGRFEVVSNTLLRPPLFANSCGNVRKGEWL